MPEVGAAVLVIASVAALAAALTIATSVAELFGLLFCEVVATVAVLVNVPVCVGIIKMASVTLWPAASVPTL
ncbi:MAG TPA: hypothetical protein VGN42_20565, partial [Pirellulales bacterium]|nr:hypothetical protein [Pirellulales bacterium]